MALITSVTCHHLCIKANPLPYRHFLWFPLCSSTLILTDCKIKMVKNGKWWCELTERATGCLIHNLEAAQCSRAQASHIYYSCFLLSPTLPVMQIKDPLLDEELQVSELILLAGVVVLVFWSTDWQPVKLGIWHNWLWLSCEINLWTSRSCDEVHRMRGLCYWSNRRQYRAILVFWILYGFIYFILLFFKHYYSIWRLSPKHCVFISLKIFKKKKKI